jgi:hypothetical protein
MTWMPSRSRRSHAIALFIALFTIRMSCVIGSASRNAEAAPPEQLQLRMRAAACAPAGDEWVLVVVHGHKPHTLCVCVAPRHLALRKRHDVTDDLLRGRALGISR